MCIRDSFSYCLQIHSEASKTQIQLLHFSESLAMSERPAGTPSCAAILVYEPYGPQIDHRFFHSSFRLRTAHVVIYPFAGQGVPRICVFSYRIWLVMYMKVWPSTVGSISEKLIQSNSARPHLTVDYGIPHGNTTTLAAILSCRSWHLRIGT